MAMPDQALHVSDTLNPTRANTRREEGHMASTVSIITLAELRVDEAEMRSSAEICISDAHRCLAAGNEEGARAWALRSLAYSVGVFHEEYQWAAA
jgi:hypothetical protein